MRRSFVERSVELLVGKEVGAERLEAGSFVVKFPNA